MTNGDEAMSPAEFAKLMGAYPQPAENPLPTYGGYMDNSPANFAWVNNNAYFGAETFEAGQKLECDLCGLSKHKKIENQWGDTFYYCTNDEPNEYSDGCVWGDRAEGKWLMDDGMHYNGVVVGIDNPDNAYLENNCPQCGASFVVSDAKNIDHCDGCVSDWDAETFEAFKDNPQFRERNYYGAEYAGGEYDDGEDYINTDHNTIYGQVNFTQITHNGTREHYNTAHFNIPVGDFLKLNKKYIEIERDVYGAETFGADSDNKLHGWATNMRLGVKNLIEDLENGAVYDLDDCRERLEKIRDDTSHLDAEMNELTDSLVDVSNRFGESVGMIEVEDYEDADRIEDVEITVSDKDGMKVVNTSLEDFYTPDDEDDYDFDTYESPKMMVQKNTGWMALASVALGTLAYFNRDTLTSSVKKVFNNETQEMLENDPELIENPNTGNLDPAQYEELVVQSTGYAVDVIPIGLDGSFMGSRFAALPTERYVEYNDPGIGAHTDIALNRDEMYLEPEMAMVQASENVIKEAQAPGQSPYNSITGEENPDFDYRVLKETHPVSLDPAVKPFIPQSMTGYTGNANTPPSVMNKMFNIGVLGQTPAFVPGSSDMGASHFGSRNATPNTLGLGGSVGGPLSDQVNASYTDGTNSMSLAQWAIENTVSQTSDTEAVVIDRSSGLMKRVRRV